MTNLTLRKLLDNQGAFDVCYNLKEMKFKLRCLSSSGLLVVVKGHNIRNPVICEEQYQRYDTAVLWE